MRTGELVLLAPSCSDVACDSAPCQLSAHWPIAWTVGPPEPPADWSTDWSVLFLFPAAEKAVESLDWSTEPPPPYESIRTGELELLAPVWVESAVESAFWPFFAD